ncbi:OmpA family protein [uncultured Paraglaciecola sp.]|uniref:OmpA family protein n=1 Tax=uncultured Paraglaciecola sp. TaxID=1765024 RepID=UPI0030DB1126|tara:strand:+ start:238419 stop:240182 length:1764 start_codon:yes stop_codon:yes gene_type:complete
MAHLNEQPSSQSDTDQMRQIRKLVLGDDGLYVKQTLKDNARELVGDVFSEALHDREAQDGSVNKVLLPLVEKSVEKSVAANSERFVGYLYPLIGSLVRKSVTAFITELLEKTNTLIENSLTIKGLTWRFKAWQSGVTFSQYAASQTFAFRVEQVFLIHRETGLLLNSVSLGLELEADADMVSSMLTAINDFVSDSFSTNTGKVEQNLDVVRTDDFTLLLKKGPKASVVAAITGNMPQGVANQLQTTLEEIHKLYDKELDNFNGDSVPFNNSEHQLRDCLMTVLKPEHSNNKKPWMAWTVVLLLLIGSGFLFVKRWNTHELMNQVKLIDSVPGIILTSIDTLGLEDIQLEVLRDPASLTIQEWLEQHGIESSRVIYKERAYLSLDPPLIKNKTESIIARYPSVTVDWMDNIPNISGKLTNLNKLLLQGELTKLIGLNFQTTWLDKIIIEGTANTAADDPELIRAILDLNIAKIDRVSIAFEAGQSDLSEQAIEKLFEVKQQFNNLIEVAQQQELSLGLIIMGASDTVGTVSFNKILSQKRADNVKLKLQELGIAASRLNAIGLGVIELETAKEGARKVMFNVVYFEGG